jgi:hypothetical protein
MEKTKRWSCEPRGGRMWVIDLNGDYDVADCGPAVEAAAHDRAETICRAVNAHADLVAALKAARRAMTNERYNAPRIGMERECDMADAAIAKATDGAP